jgi:hypothetical protein
MSKKKKAQLPFYAQVLSNKFREEEERRKALHQAAIRVFKPEQNPTPRKGSDAP